MAIPHDGADLLERLRTIHDQLATRLITQEDRRRLLRVTVNGLGGFRSVDLDKAWSKGIQAQNLGREIATAYRSARKQAFSLADELYTDADISGLATWVLYERANLRAHLDAVVDVVPGARTVMNKLDSETVRGTAARGRVASRSIS